LCLRISLLYLLLLSVVLAGPSARAPYYESSDMHANVLPAFSSERFAHTPTYSGPHAGGGAASESATSLLDDLFAELGARVPAFGGMFLDGDVLKVYLTSPAQMVSAEAAIVVVFGRERIPAGGIQVLPAQYAFLQLSEWHNRLGPLFDIQGVVFTDIDERVNRLKVAVADDAVFDIVEQEVLRLGIPREAFAIVRTEPFGFAASLRDKIRPTEGGTQIAFSSWLCTLGFNAVRASDGLQGFVVNSHCTNTQGGVEGTSHYQPTVASGNLIGTEIADPAYTAGKCPPDLTGYVCRYSDSAFSQRDSALSADMGLVARPDSVNTGSLTIGGTLRILGEGSSVVGEVLGKVGRTTGWTQGQVTQTCAHLLVSGTNIVQLCQDLVSAGVGPGDSGSPVFFVTNSQYDVELRGILWGSSGGTTFVYSPIANIERTDELGQLTTTSNGPPTISTLTPDKASPQVVGATITWTCSAGDPEGDLILYRFWLQTGSESGPWAVTQDWSGTNTWSWTPTVAGSYGLGCWVRDDMHAGSTGFDDRKIVYDYSIVPSAPNSPPRVSSLASDKASPEVVGTTISWTCSATDPEGDPILFRFWVQSGSEYGPWTVTQDWSSLNTWTWTPTSPLTYGVGCWVRDGKHAGSTGFDDRKIIYGYSITPAPPPPANSPPTASGLMSDKASPQGVGTTITWTCSASDLDSDPILYRFWVQLGSEYGPWIIAQDYSSSNTWIWTPTDAMSYGVGCWVRDGKHASSTGFDDRKIVYGYSIAPGAPNSPPIASSLTSDKASPQSVGTTIAWTCSASDAENDPIFYRFWLQTGSESGPWTITQDWSATNTWSWTPTAAMTYGVGCWIRDGKHAGSTGFDDRKIVYGYTITSGFALGSWLFSSAMMLGEQVATFAPNDRRSGFVGR